jgi:thiol-disulfide isomerase/thioredoxin
MHKFVQPIWYGEDTDIDDDGNLSPPELKGKPTIGFIFASWCPHCSNASPTLQEFAEKNKDKCNVVVFQSDGERDSEKKAVKKLSSKLPKFRGFPHYFATDKTGKMTDHVAPGRDLKSLENLLEKI